MTISTTSSKVNAVGDNVIVAFNFNFHTLLASDITVYLDNVLVSDTLYSIVLTADQEASPGGTVTMNTAPGNGVVHTILRVGSKTQTTVYTPYDPFPAKSHEAGLDKLTLLVQENANSLLTVVKPPINDDGTTDYSLPSYEANKGIKWDTPTKRFINTVNNIDDAASEAAASAAAAAASATSSSSSAAAASGSATAADNTLKDFETKYLGAKAVDPTVDNEGGALINGAVYWNTTASVMRVYNGAAWENSATIVGISDSATGPVLTLTDTSVSTPVAFTSGSPTSDIRLQSISNTPFNFRATNELGGTIYYGVMAGLNAAGQISNAAGTPLATFNYDRTIALYGSINSTGAAIFGSTTSGNTVQCKSSTSFNFFASNNVGGGVYFAVSQSSATPSALIHNNGGVNIVSFNNDLSSRFSGDINLANAKNVYCGDTNQLEINHDGANGNINNSSGILYIRSLLNDGLVNIQTPRTSGAVRNGIIVGGAIPVVKQHYDGALATTTIAGGLNFGVTSLCSLRHDGSNADFTNTQGTMLLLQRFNSGLIDLRSYDSAGALMTGLTSGGAIPKVTQFFNNVIATTTIAGGMNAVSSLTVAGIPVGTMVVTGTTLDITLRP